jgi:hypothetical protein
LFLGVFLFLFSGATSLELFEDYDVLDHVQTNQVFENDEVVNKEAGV